MIRIDLIDTSSGASLHSQFSAHLRCASTCLNSFIILYLAVLRSKYSINRHEDEWTTWRSRVLIRSSIFQPVNSIYPKLLSVTFCTSTFLKDSSTSHIPERFPLSLILVYPEHDHQQCLTAGPRLREPLSANSRFTTTCFHWCFQGHFFRICPRTPWSCQDRVEPRLSVSEGSWGRFFALWTRHGFGLGQADDQTAQASANFFPGVNANQRTPLISCSYQTARNGRLRLALTIISISLG